MDWRAGNDRSILSSEIDFVFDVADDLWSVDLERRSVLLS